MSKTPGVIVARPKRPPGLLVCGKCLRKAEDGRSVRKALKAALSDRAAAEGRRPGKLVETKCLGLCPKRAVALADGAGLARGELLVVRRLEDVPAAMAALRR